MVERLIGFQRKNENIENNKIRTGYLFRLNCNKPT